MVRMFKVDSILILSTRRRLPMKGCYYIGLDIHKRIIAFCVKLADGTIIEEGTIPATRKALRIWAEGLDRPMVGSHGSHFVHRLDL